MRFLILLIIFFSSSIYSQADFYYKKSIRSLERNKIDSAAHYYRKAYKISPSLNSKYLVTYSKILKKLGKPDSSYFYLDKAEKEIKKNNVPDSILLIYALKAELSRYTVSPSLNHKTISEADSFLTKNKKKIKNIDIIAYYLNRKMASFNAFHYGSKDTIQLILDVSKEILSLESQINNKEIVAYTLNEIAHIYDYNIDKKQSVQYYEKAYQYSKNNHLASAFIDNSINYARYFQVHENDLNKAIDVLLDAEKQINSNNDVYQVARFYDFISVLCALNGEYKNAFEYHKKTTVKLLEIEQNKNNLYIKDLEFENRIRDKQNEINLQNQKLKEVKKNQNLFFIIVFLIFVGVLILIFYNQKINKKNKELEYLSRENQFLLGEANHRINNNLQLITILIAEELKKNNEKESNGIKKILSKVESIATLHRHLYKSDNKKKINIKNYLSEIRSNFYELFEEYDIKEKFNVESFEIDTDVAMYLGLLLTELYINTIKHAFHKEQLNKEITFGLTLNENKFIFMYSNNGEKERNKKIEPKLISKICRQLKVNYEIETSKGFHFQFFKNI